MSKLKPIPLILVRVVILLNFLFLSNSVVAQNSNFNAIDTYAMSAPENAAADLNQLYLYLIKPAKNDEEKIRSFYVWICCHIKYDMTSFLADKTPAYDAPTVFKNRTAVCEGFANLFEALCKKAKIPVYVVTGYSKGYGYIEGSSFSETDHAWNVVKINNQWHLFDPTWDGTSTNEPLTFPDRKFSGSYFKMAPDKFWIAHLPSDPLWQLSENILSLNDFEKAKSTTSVLSPRQINYFSFKDTLNSLQKADPASARISSAKRALKFNPKNCEARMQLAFGYYEKGQNAFKKITKMSVKEYDKNHHTYDSLINSSFELAYTFFMGVKPYMVNYKEAKKAAADIVNYRISSDTKQASTNDKNYKVRNTFNPRVLDKNSSIDIQKLEVLNSIYRETNLSVSPDGNRIVFESDRGGQKWSVLGHESYKSGPSYDSNIWYAQRVNGQFQKPICLKLNTPSNEGDASISPDGKKIVYQSWNSQWTSAGGPYYIKDLNVSGKRNPIGLGDGISRFFIHSMGSSNGGYATDGASMSPSGKRFIVACGKNYNGDLDFYMSDKDDAGKWGLLRPLSLSTKKDDRSIFIGADGVTVFFASAGYGGFGGLDIFKTTLNARGEIGEIINLGSKINTKGDDYGFIIDAAGTTGYFIRDGDIYQANFSEALPEITCGKTVVIKGNISHNYPEKLKCDVRITDPETRTELGFVKCDDTDGSYYCLLKDVHPSYRISVLNGSKVLAEKRINADTVSNYTEIIKDFKLKIDPKMVVSDSSIKILRMRGENYESGIFRSVNFEYDNYSLSSTYFARMDSIVHYLKTNSRARLGIAGYSDFRGLDEYKTAISQKRAQAVYAYFIRKGIAKHRLIAAGYGASNPITLSTTIQGGYINRRVEFLIVNDLPRGN